MALDKNSYQSDAIANLYRSALYLARDSRQTGLNFFSKAKQILGERLEFTPDLQKNNRYLAEKILDIYKNLTK